ncbi:hypothetical protein ACIRVK_44695 [Streptomyces sp. NPDC101152]|uniref:hypothetical protein n=1 Tax=Streptomyces sp. NPDC101152 TaxID=3366116 RepID=UPI00381DB1A6
MTRPGLCSADNSTRPAGGVIDGLASGTDDAGPELLPGAVDGRFGHQPGLPGTVQTDLPDGLVGTDEILTPRFGLGPFCVGEQEVLEGVQSEQDEPEHHRHEQSNHDHDASRRTVITGTRWQKLLVQAGPKGQTARDQRESLYAVGVDFGYIRLGMPALHARLSGSAVTAMGASTDLFHERQALTSP